LFLFLIQFFGCRTRFDATCQVSKETTLGPAPKICKVKKKGRPVHILSVTNLLASTQVEAHPKTKVKLQDMQRKVNNNSWTMTFGFWRIMFGLLCTRLTNPLLALYTHTHTQLHIVYLFPNFSYLLQKKGEKNYKQNKIQNLASTISSLHNFSWIFFASLIANLISLLLPWLNKCLHYTIHAPVVEFAPIYPVFFSCGEGEWMLDFLGSFCSKSVAIQVFSGFLSCSPSSHFVLQHVPNSTQLFSYALPNIVSGQNIQITFLHNMST
jgi:hypothetical protein